MVQTRTPHRRWGGGGSWCKGVTNRDLLRPIIQIETLRLRSYRELPKFPEKNPTLLALVPELKPVDLAQGPIQ